MRPDLAVVPAASVALTTKVCVPSGRPLYSVGELQGANGAASSLHCAGSLVVNVKPADRLLVGLAGSPVIATVGAALSIVHVLLDRAEAWARERGSDRLTLSALVTNSRARALYGRRGFAGEYIRYVLPLK